MAIADRMWLDAARPLPRHGDRRQGSPGDL